MLVCAGTTSVLAKWGDRVLIALCVLNDAAFVLQLPHAKERAVAGSTLALSVACYFLAKVAHTHITSHPI